MNEYIQLFQSSYTFKTVTIGCSLLGMISAIIGSFTVLKKESLVGDGIAHASLAGVCLAFLLTEKKELYILLLGALLTGIICIGLIYYIQGYSKIKFDSAIALVLSSFFGLGLVLLSYLKKVPGAKKAGLNRFIFGQASTIIIQDIYIIVGTGIILLFILILFWKEIKISIFDSEYAKTLGIDSEKIKFLTSILTIVNIIVGIEVAGVILMTAIMIIPAVAARQWSDRLFIVVIISAILGLLSGAIGSVVSTLDASLPTGPIIVVVLSLFLIISLLFSTKRGVLKKIYARYRRNREIRIRIYGGDKK